MGSRETTRRAIPGCNTRTAGRVPGWASGSGRRAASRRSRPRRRCRCAASTGRTRAPRRSRADASVAIRLPRAISSTGANRTTGTNPFPRIESPRSAPARSARRWIEERDQHGGAERGGHRQVGQGGEAVGQPSGGGRQDRRRGQRQPRREFARQGDVEKHQERHADQRFGKPRRPFVGQVREDARAAVSQ